MKKSSNYADRSRNTQKKSLRISISVILEEEAEVDPNEEFEGYAEKLKKSVTKSFFEESRGRPSVCSNLAEYNKKAVDDAEKECTDLSQLSFSLEKRTLETESAACGCSTRDVSENAEFSEDEGIQKPSTLTVTAPSPLATHGPVVVLSEEDVLPTPSAKSLKRINFSVVPKTERKLENLKAKATLTEAITARETHKDAKKMVSLLKDFREGYLEKRSNSLLTLWKEKYCRVGSSQFSFYRDIAAGWLSGFIDFRRVPSKVEIDRQSLCFIISIWTGKSYKPFVFRAANYTDLLEWTQAVYLNIEKLKPAVLDRPLCSIDKFWKHRTIPYSALKERVDTADLLLFSGTRFACKFQRFLTRSRFDHVGMLLRYQDGRIFLLEATNNEGVGVSEWDDEMARCYKSVYSAIVYRQLQYKRTYQQVTKLEKFLKNARGKKYKLDPLRLLQKYSSTDSVENLHENKGYFCSELIASAYKTLGILPKDISSAQYWPGTFSAEGKLKLQNGARLGDELLIEFDN